MNICIYGFNHMFIGGKYVGQPIFLKKIVDEFSSLGHSCYFLFLEDISEINSIGHQLALTFLPLSTDNLEFIHNEFMKYDLDELNDMVHADVEKARLLKKIDLNYQYKHTAIKILEVLRKYDNQVEFDMFVVWGTGYIPRTISHYARKNNKKLVILENGYFRPFTLTVDSKGVNAENSVPRNPDFYKSIRVDSEKMSKYLKKPFSAEIDDALSRQFISANLPENHTSDTVFSEDAPFGEYLFVPFQLQTDSQIIRHSPHIKLMKELVVYTIASVNYYNSQFGKDMGIIFKPHPQYKRDGTSFDLKEIVQICKPFNNVMIAHSIDNQKLIRGCRAVITINSPVGIEALMEKKKVITLGDAFYNIPGIAHHTTPGELMRNLKEILDEEPNYDLISSFLYFLRFEYLAETFYPDADKQSIGKLVDKMFQINQNYTGVSI